MTLETLPPELLAHIFSYVDVASLSFVSKRIRAVALKFILSSLKVHFPGDTFEAISGFLRHSNNSQHVRTLYLANTAEKVVPAAMRRLIEFLGRLTGLKSIACSERIALSLLAVRDSLPQCELLVRGFQLRECLGRKDYQLSPRFNLLTSSCLVSLECYVDMLDLPRGSKVLSYDEDEDDEEDEEGSSEGADPELDQDILMDQAESIHFAEVVNFLAGVVPNLKRLDLKRYYAYGSVEIPRQRARRAKLLHLDLTDAGNPQRMLLEGLKKATDFEVLETLFLPEISKFTHQWLDKNSMSLPRLKHLKMRVPLGYYVMGDQSGYEYTGNCWTYVENFLMNVPPLKKLELTGDYNHVLGACLEHHSTLESLTLRHTVVPECKFAGGIELKLLRRILRYENLTFLDIQMRKSGDDGIWKMLQDSRVETLMLTFTYLEQDYKPTGIDWRKLLECIAIDEALVRSIYEACGLEYLQLASVINGREMYLGDDPATVEVVLHELTGSFSATRVEGRVHIVEMPKLPHLVKKKNAIKLDSGFMDIFRSIWPSKGGDWADDWHSLPLFANA